MSGRGRHGASDLCCFLFCVGLRSFRQLGFQLRKDAVHGVHCCRCCATGAACSQAKRVGFVFILSRRGVRRSGGSRSCSSHGGDTGHLGDTRVSTVQHDATTKARVGALHRHRTHDTLLHLVPGWRVAHADGARPSWFYNRHDTAVVAAWTWCRNVGSRHINTSACVGNCRSGHDGCRGSSMCWT